MTNKITWLLNRLQRMSVQEMIFRLLRAARQILEKLCVSLLGIVPEHDWQLTEFKLFGQIPQRVSADKPSRITAVSNLQKGRIDFFGSDYLDTGAEKNWHKDPKTGTVAPLIFGKSIDYRDDKLVGNIKYVWEWGRHQHLVPLAIHYYEQRDQETLDSIVLDITTWIEQNPYCMGVHWCSSLEAGLRLSSWAVVHGLLCQCGFSRGIFDCVDKPQALRQSIYQQAYFIRNYLSLYSSANNHLIGELTGLWVACKVFGLGEHGKQWAEFARTMLEKQAKLQVHSDGVNKEQAIYYHLWVMEYFLFCWLVGERSGHSFSKEFQQTIEKMALFLRDLMPVGGYPPQIGDADDGTVVRFDALTPGNPYLDCLLAIEQSMAVDLQLGDIDRRSEKAFWYGTIASLERDAPRILKRSNDSKVWPEGGYAVLKGKAAMVCFDAGPLGYTSIAAHGHADALSFNVAIGADWWIIDPGTYAYHSGQEWRNYFRGTLAHNTIRLGEIDQSEIAGPFMWSRQAAAQISDIERDDEQHIVRGVHDGYQRIGWTHKRAISLRTVEDRIHIADNLVGPGTTSLQFQLHFAPSLKLRLADKHTLIVSRPHYAVQMKIFFDPRLQISLHRGETQPIMGWYSAKLDEKEPSGMVLGRMQIHQSAEFSTTIELLEADTSE